jgi:lysophospholipase L1-like esterase
VLTGIFPRHDNPAAMPVIEEINGNLARMADGKKVRYLNVNDRMVEGTLNARDKLHPTVQGYQVWADALKPVFTELLGPPAKEDHAPAPTGDPSAKH